MIIHHVFFIALYRLIRCLVKCITVPVSEIYFDISIIFQFFSITIPRLYAARLIKENKKDKGKIKRISNCQEVVVKTFLMYKIKQKKTKKLTIELNTLFLTF